MFKRCAVPTICDMNTPTPAIAAAQRLRQQDLDAHAAEHDATAEALVAASAIHVAYQLWDADIIVLTHALQVAIERDNMHWEHRKDICNMLADIQAACIANRNSTAAGAQS
jgi:hypothetical protein